MYMGVSVLYDMKRNSRRRDCGISQFCNASVQAKLFSAPTELLSRPALQIIGAEICTMLARLHRGDMPLHLRQCPNGDPCNSEHQFGIVYRPPPPSRVSSFARAP
jgi:hypothetical protein